MKKESKFKIAQRYALALYEAALDDNVLDKVARDLDALSAAVHENKDAVKYLANPLWNLEDKKSALKSLTQKLNLTDDTFNLLCVIADNSRFNELPEILQAFRSLYLQKNNMVDVKVETVMPLSSAQENLLKKNLQKFLNKEVVLSYEIKPDLLGGLVISYASDMIDDSIKGKLNRLETIMKGGQ